MPTLSFISSSAGDRHRSAARHDPSRANPSATDGVGQIPVITAVEIAPGIARRSNAYWQAIWETAIITAMPAADPLGSAEGLR